MRLLIIPLILCLVGCHPLFCTWDFEYNQLTSDPGEDSIYGEYRLNESSIENLKDQGFKEDFFAVRLYQDRTYKFINGPDLIFNRNGSTRNEIMNRTGKWFYSCNPSYACVIELERVCVVPLSEKNGTLAIPITIGDGDECEGIVYEKYNKMK